MPSWPLHERPDAAPVPRGARAHAPVIGQATDGAGASAGRRRLHPRQASRNVPSITPIPVPHRLTSACARRMLIAEILHVH